MYFLWNTKIYFNRMTQVRRHCLLKTILVLLHDEAEWRCDFNNRQKFPVKCTYTHHNALRQNLISQQTTGLAQAQITARPNY